MVSITSTVPVERAEARAQRAPRRGLSERWLSPALLSPSLIAIFIFVYGFIGYTFWVSISNWKTNRRDLSVAHPWYKTYDTLFHQTRFQIDLRNTFVFTVLFLAISIFSGLALALMLDRR